MPKVFISYARDGGAGEVLAAEVQTQLQQQNFEVFRDVIGLKPGDVWYHKLEFELESSDFVVLVVSEKVRTSKWVHNEISMAEEVGIPVIPVLAEKIRSPLWLRHLQQLDFCGDREWGRLFEVLGAKIPPVPPFSKGGTFRSDVVEVDRMVSPFAKGGTRGISTPVWAENSNTDNFGQYADLSVKGVVQRLRWIEPGTFMMGSPESEKERRDNETQREVMLTRGFWMADTAVTQALWQVVMGNNPGYFKGEQLPVESINWNDCQQFLRQLNETDSGLQARLPWAAEWEYACRAGTTTPFSFGENITPDQVNYNGGYPYDGGKKGKYRTQTVAVKSLPHNKYALYEMHGNVWEWCQDKYQDDPGSDHQTDLWPGGNQPAEQVGQQSSAKRVLRGGSWFLQGGNCRSAFRRWYGPDFRNGSIGLRLSLGH